MPLLADRVRETTTTTGQGTLTLAGAVTGFRTFSGAFGNGVSVYYVIAGGSEWEIGFGTTGAGTLTRDTVLVSSAGGTTKVTFSAGTKDVFCSYVADRAVTTSDAATLTNKTIDDYTNNVGANSTHFRIKAGATLVKGDIVKASGFTPGEAAIEVVKVASSTDVALGFVEQALSTGQFGTAVVIGELFDVNTNGLAVGATLYSNGSGGFTTTRPASGLFQALGWVVRANTNNGVIAVNVVNPQYVEATAATANTLALRDGSGDFAAGTITAALSGNASTATALQTARNINGVSFNGTADITVTAAAGTLSGTTLASNVVSSSLTSVGTLASLAVTGAVTLNGDAIVLRDAANTLAQRNSTNAQTFRLYNTFTDASNYERTAITTAAFGGVRYQQILAESAGTGAANLGIVLAPKGTGAFSLHMPDGTTAGGNARGTYAVDLSLARAAANQVASGTYSFNAGVSNIASGSLGSAAIGYLNTSSGSASFTAGQSNTASGNLSSAIGFGNTASAASAFVCADSNTASGASSFATNFANTASGNTSFAAGRRGVADKYGQVAFGIDRFANSGDAQWSVLGFRGETTTGSIAEIFLDGQSNTRATVPASTTWMATLMVTARTRNGISNAAFERRCIIKRDGANSTTLVGSVQTIGTDIKTDTDLDLSVTITADDTNEALKLEVTGKMGGTVSTLTSSGTTCTLTSTANHGLSTGDYVTIAGANETAYNGTFVITSTGATTFTYTAATTPSATPATGTITANINCRWVARVDCVEVGHPV